MMGNALLVANSTMDRFHFLSSVFTGFSLSATSHELFPKANVTHGYLNDMQL
jgi:hypothetical protein